MPDHPESEISTAALVPPAGGLPALLRFDAKVYHNAKVCGDWLLREHKLGQTCFHVVTMGSCRVRIPGELDTTLQAGDLLFFPKELAHTLVALRKGAGLQRHLPYAAAAAEAGTGLLCAEVLPRDGVSRLLLEALPPVLLIRNEPEHDWLPRLMDLIVTESAANRLFGAGITNRLCELLFAYTLSAYLSQHGHEHHENLLGLYLHPRLAPVVAAVHAEPGEPWTLDRLARLAAQSRTPFCIAFRHASGMTPMQYVAWWRMQVARSLLQQGSSVMEAAQAVGYGSTAAFSRVFKSVCGVNPTHVKERAVLQPRC